MTPCPWSVVIPSNSAERLRRCVNSILDRHMLDPKSIVVVDDGASEGWKADDPKVTFTPGVKPFIYARNVNIGIDYAYPKDVVIIGDDVLVKTPHAFDLLASTSHRPNAGIISPAIEGVVGNPMQKKITGGAVRESHRELCFVCVYIPRHVLQRVGTLDERFTGYGCEDVDWGWRAQTEGFRLLVDDRVVVLHNEPGMESAFRSKPEISEMAEKAKQLLRDKWPGRFSS